jgi:hypothetical protein
MHKFLTYVALVGGLSSQFASLAGVLNPKAGAIVGAVAVGAAAVGESVIKVQAALKGSK